MKKKTPWFDARTQLPSRDGRYECNRCAGVIPFNVCTHTFKKDAWRYNDGTRMTNDELAFNWRGFTTKQS